MSLAVITLSPEGAILADHLMRGLPESHLYVHEKVKGDRRAEKFASVAELTKDIFAKYKGLVYVAPCGVVVRAIAPFIESKIKDPAVVVVDVGGRWAVSLLSGHEGGANDLAITVANALSAEPIITTTTEALKTLIVGVGCRRGTTSEKIVAAIKEALTEADLEISQVRSLSSADIKSDEQGLLQAARELGLPLRFISSDEIRGFAGSFEHSDFVQEKVDLPAVAEPAALIAGRRTRLVLKKRTFNGVTVAVARESCLW
jgi:cobalt-precorrin 5A hydrolase